MLDSDIQAKQSERDAIQEATARFLKAVGQIEAHTTEMRDLDSGCWRRLAMRERASKGLPELKPKPKRAKAASVQDRLRAEVDAVKQRTDEIDEIFARLRAKEAQKK